MTQPPPLPSLNPYAAPVARVDDFVGEQLVLADRGIRLVAKIVDGMIVGGVIVIFAIVFGAMAPSKGGASASRETAMIVVGLAGGAALIALLVVNLVMLHRHGQTIAKRLFGIKIVRVDGSHCELLRIVFARWLPVTVLGAIPFLGSLIALVDALMIFGTEQRCLHDLFADTIVVKA